MRAAMHQQKVQSMYITNAGFKILHKKTQNVNKLCLEENSTEHFEVLAVCITLSTCTWWRNKTQLIINAVALIYLRHERHLLLLSGVQVYAVQRDLHLSQESVSAEATMMPDWYLHGSSGQLCATDGVLSVEDERDKTGCIKGLSGYWYSDGVKSYNFNVVVVREL